MSGNKTFWWTVLVGWIAGCVYWHVCKIRQLCDAPLLSSETVDSVSVSQIPPVVYTSLRITDSSGLELSSVGNIRFAKSGYTPDVEAVKNELDSLARYLLALPRKLTITGGYLSDEKNTSKFPNLGLARSNEIKKIFVGAGVADLTIQLNFQVDSLLTPILQSDSLSGGIQFLVERLPETELGMAEAERYESIFKSMDLYFLSAGTNYIETGENKKFITEARKYLADHPDKRLHLTGHTDDQDSAAWNLKLSKKRAESVKRQFMESGIDATRIVAGGMGEASPKASNATPSGKMANRRVTIVVK